MAIKDRIVLGTAVVLTIPLVVLLFVIPPTV